MSEQIPGQMTVDSVMGDMLVNPISGEVLDPKTVHTEALLEAHDQILDGERQMSGLRRQIDDELVRRADHEGRRSLTFSEFKVDVTAPTEKHWDVGRLQLVLSDLVAEELLSQDKALRCVKHEPKVVWGEVKTLLSDPRVRDQIEACFEEVAANRYVRVSRRG